MKFFLRVFLVMVITALGLPSLGFSAPITYIANLDGASESPPNASPGIGSATVYYDPVSHLLQVNVTFSGLTAATTAAHIHARTVAPFTGIAGVATQVPAFPGFPLGVTSGSFASSPFDLTLPSSWNPAFITAQGSIAAAETTLAEALAANEAYLNIHTTTFPGGEIRGFLVAPIPASMLLFGTGLAGLAGCRFRKK